MNTQLPETWQKELINIDHSVDWVLETSLQLMKDFEMLGYPLQLDNKSVEGYTNLLDQVVAYIARLSASDHQAWMNLLYRIDLPEREMHKLKNQSPSPETFYSFAETILKREFMKVVYRHRYSR